MFDFLFKRTPAQKAAKAAIKAEPKVIAAAPAAANAALAAQAQISRQQEKQAALEQARQLGDDEDQALALLLQCQFADARLLIAEKLHSKPQLERALQAMRNTDRRVEKLIQQRLQFLAHQAQQQQQLASCVQLAQTLLVEAQLMPNQVADLDRRWQVAGGKDAHAEFDALRQQLAQRLQQQMHLQRAIRDQISTLQQAMAAQSLNQLAQALEQSTQLQQQPELDALPKTLLQELSQTQTQAAAQLQQLQQADQAEQARAQKAQLHAELQAEQAAEQAAQQAAQRAAQQANEHANEQADPAIAQAQTEGSSNSSAPDASVHPAPAPTPAPVRPAKIHTPPDPASLQQFASALSALEQALEQGLLHAAFEQDKTLRDLKQVKPNAQQAGRLTQARAELHRLQGWAKWGGNVSREELVKAVEDLPQQGLAVMELAKKVGSMRERWKKLDTASGAAPKSLWERFDNACTEAYAPAAAHFKKLGEERQHNVQLAQAMLEQIRQFNADFAPDSADWRQVAHFAQRQRQHWQQLGPVERKDKKKLDQEFEQLMAHSGGALAEQRKREVAKREQMIKQVQECNPHDRATLDLLRQLQESWQEHAKALPLERKPEQDLWQRFRAACDAVFAARKESAHVADAERRNHLQAKEALCAQLEAAALDTNAQEAAKLLRSSQDAWQHVGAVPRAQEAAIEQRFQRARQNLQQQIDQVKRTARQQEHQHIRQKLALCQELENALLADSGAIEVDAWQQRWQALPALGRELENTLAQRFGKALQLDAAYAQQLHSNRDGFLSELLRLEILLGLESPESYARERLKIQVQVLQASMRSGQKTEAPQAQVLRLCALPVALQPDESLRLEKVLFSLFA